MTGLVSLVRRHQLSSFFILTIGLTWLAFIPFYYGGDIPLFPFGPMVAGFTVAAISGGWASVKPILASMVRWRVAPVWYVVAIGFPFAIQLASILINPVFGSFALAWENIPPLAQVLPMVALYAVFSGPLGEEPGWRGFATPRLLARHSALAGSLVLGVIWAIWHLPLGLVDDLPLYSAISPILAAIVFTWVYQNTNGSVFLLIFMHMSHQNSVRYLGKVFTDGDHVQQQWIAIALWAAACAVILLVYGTESFRRETSERIGVPNAA